ncbi:Conserved_hypothetical protein [Hexamita inflata]|uniref:Transmembrane protein n=1 Tax=Hexamita inflata TaxID=28002 RepID=A0AA86R3B7_9EUKA|nr:Conserved hypothetical protein [Hexamita inflata]CAI9978756.1 Conserved hypothetical protein [Hexamita inflata]
MFVLCLQAVVIQHGYVYHDIELKTKLQTYVYYDIFQLNVPEVLNDADNLIDYHLMLSFDTLEPIKVHICTDDSYDKCINGQRTLSYHSSSEVIQISSYAVLTGSKVYILFESMNFNSKVSFQVQNEIVLTPQAKQFTVAANQDLYLTAARCDGTSFNLLLDPLVQFCVSDNAHVAKKDCPQIQSGKTSYTFENPKLYTFITVFATDVQQTTNIQMDIHAGEYQVNTTNVRKIYRNQNCYIMNRVVLGKIQSYIYTQEIQNTSYRKSVTSKLVNEDQNQIDETTQLIDSLTSGDFSIISSSQETAAVMPWLEIEYPILLLWFVISPDLSQLKENQIKQVQSHMVFDYSPKAPGKCNTKDLNYSLAFTAGSSNFYVTNKYGTLGDSCVNIDGRCQVLLEGNTQIKVAENVLYYALFNSFSDDNIISAPLQTIEVNTLIQDLIPKQSSRYYRANVKDLHLVMLQLQSNYSVGKIKIISSSTIYLPQDNDPRVKVAEAMGQIKFKIIDQNEVFIHIINEALQNIEIQLQLIPSNVFTQLLVNQQKQSMYSQPSDSIIVGVKIPKPIIINNQVAFFSQVVFQSTAVFPPECEIHFDQYGSDQYFRYASLNKDQNLITFSITLSQKELLENDFVYVNITSTCYVDVKVIPVFAHQMDSTVQTAVSRQQLAVLTHEHIVGFDRHIDVQFSTFKNATLYICPFPVLLGQNVSVHDCEIRTSDFSVYIASTDFKSAQLYYTFKAQDSSMGDLQPVTFNSKLIASINPGAFSQFLSQNIYHYSVATTEQYVDSEQIDNFQNLCLSVQQLSGKLCLSRNFIQNNECDQYITSPGIYTIKPLNGRAYLQIEPNKSQIVTFEGHFITVLQNKTEVFKINGQKMFVFKRENINNSVLLTAVFKQEEYHSDFIPEVMFMKKVAMFVNTGETAHKNRFKWSETQVGAQGMVIPPGQEENIYITLYTKENIEIELSSIEKEHVYNLDHGKTRKVQVNPFSTVDFVLDSAYAPSGAIIETCHGSTEASFSYYHVPSTGSAYSQKLEINSQESGQVKAVLNSTNERQNFFATVQTGEETEFVIYHSYTDLRPQVSSGNIRINRSTEDGFLTVIVDPATHTQGVRYMVYLLTEDLWNQKTACGMKRGALISDKARLQTGESVVVINTTVALEIGVKYWLNVIAADSKDANVAMAYRPIEARRGMDFVDEEYYENEGNQSFTWIIWVVLSVIIVVVALVTLFYFIQRKQYTRLVDQELQKQNNKARYKAAQQTGGIEDSM